MNVKWIKRAGFRLGLVNPWFFRNFVRPMAYKIVEGDAERVHEIALETMAANKDIIRDVASQFYYPNLKVTFCGKSITPFGTSAGLDKNADALEPLSYIFGFHEFGTVVVNPREGNKRPRVVADAKARIVYNAQGFPQKGLEYTLKKVRKYREDGGKGTLLANICGLPPEVDKIQIAHQELRQLVSSLEPYVEGLVWNPYSPNTAALKMLRTPEEFKHSAEIITDCAPEKPIFVKMGPYEDCPEEQEPWLKLAHAWTQGGGTGFVAVNTKMVNAEKVPLKEWGYPSAGKSGKALQDYRRRAISDLRKTFPDAEIIATGGIDSGNEAWDSFSRGANVVAGYTPYIFEGFGLQRNIAREIQNNLSLLNYDTLVEFQANKYRL